ncbi:MAG: NlpC/P60 family protein [Elusimicrobiota bacterium]
MISRILLAVLLLSAAAPVRAEDALQRVRRKAKQLIEDARLRPGDADLQFRVTLAKAILAQGSNIRYELGAKGGSHDDCRWSDCSGYMSSTAGLYCKLSGSSGDMYSQAQRAGALSGEPEFLNAVFFHKPGGTAISHVGYYVDDEVFLNMGGKAGSLLRVTRYDSNDSADHDDTTWAGDRVSYADLTKIPRRTESEIAAIAARANGEKVIRTGPSVPGGVYISPELVLEAAGMDDSGFLDSLEQTISGLDFDRSPVQEIPDLTPPDGFGSDDPGSAPRARVEGSGAYQELLRARE